MTRTVNRRVLVGISSLIVFGLAVSGPRWTTVRVSGQAAASGLPSSRNGEWPHYTAELNGSRYSPLDQINGTNFNKLEVAWRFKTENLGPFPEFKLEGTPLMVKGVVYTTGGTRRSVVALDARTGELIWTYSLREGKRAAVAPRQLSGRGVSYWTDGKGDDRVVYITTGYRLVSLNARTGQPVQSFGTNGIVDLKQGVVYGNRQPINLETGEIGVHSTPAVVKDTIVVGSSFREGQTVPTHNNTKGLVRAFDARTGKLIWTFNTIPRPGEFGSDTWENDSWSTNGNTGVWTEMSADEDLGLVYLPVESPSSDFYGGHRPGNNLFGESLVAVDLKTGQRKWHYQYVHHPIWNFDNCCAPLLLDINVDGRTVKAIASPSKLGFLYVLDRATGQPVWPIEERPVPQSDVPGEKTAATQPFPTRPPAYARNYLKYPDDVIDFTPELKAQALEILKRYKVGNSPFTPPILGDLNGLIGAVGAGTATNWPGSAADPETHVVFAQAGNTPSSRSLVAPPPGFSDIRYVAGAAGRAFREVFGPGDCCAADSGHKSTADLPQRTPPPPAGAAAPPDPGLSVQGLPLVKPPYGLLSAINLDRGEILWQVPHGDTPDNIRNHPALRGLTIPKTGQAGTSGVGLMVTKTVVVMGDPQVTTTPEHPRGAMLRAYDKKTGEEVGAVYMEAPQTGSPMSYMLDGKQYLTVSIGGPGHPAELVVYKLGS
jgi:quinoprotein glucose dehydrogenase